MSYKVVRYRAALRPGIISLLQHLLPGDETVRSAYFRWKHEENPFVEAPVVYAALHRGEVVGMRSFVATRWRIPPTGEPQTRLCACDLVIAPEHRSRGLHRRIMDVALAGLRDEGHRFVLSFSANPITFQASLKMGWRKIASYSTWARESRRGRWGYRTVAAVNGVPWVWRVKDKVRSLALHHGLDGIDSTWAGSARTSSLVFGRELPAAVMASLPDAAPSVGTGHATDTAYYRWRFGNPLSEYRFIHRQDTGSPSFIVLHRARYGNGCDLSVVDYAAPQSSVLLGMLGEIVARGGFDRLSMWTVSLPAELIDGLATLGFAPRDMSRGVDGYQPGLLMKDLDQHGAAHPASAPAGDGDSAGWDLRMIDSDAY